MVLDYIPITGITLQPLTDGSGNYSVTLTMSAVYDAATNAGLVLTFCIYGSAQDGPVKSGTGPFYKLSAVQQAAQNGTLMLAPFQGSITAGTLAASGNISGNTITIPLASLTPTGYTGPPQFLYVIAFEPNGNQGNSSTSTRFCSAAGIDNLNTYY